jgi:hypothetical protein
MTTGPERLPVAAWIEDIERIAADDVGGCFTSARAATVDRPTAVVSVRPRRDATASAMRVAAISRVSRVGATTPITSGRTCVA